MAARKLQQEIDKCFKKVDEGVAEFDSIYEKIEQSNNPSQKEKLEDNLKREIKKLQRLRDTIKGWATNNDIKDKAPLLERRKLIETQMERFKAVEKAMKTKAYSKEGLSAAAKLDPKEQQKMETSNFLSQQVDELEQQIEALEAESETIQQTMKKGKNQAAKQERIANIDNYIERHKWHQGKLELIARSLENGGVEADQVNELEETIRYYVSNGMDEDYIEDEEMYEDLNLEDEEDNYGVPHENEKGSSQDNQSIQEEIIEPEPRPSSLPGKTRSAVESASASGRRSSSQLKSPLPTLATLHQSPSVSNGNATSSSSMKPAQAPTRPAGEGLKYASAAAAAAASDRNNVGIAPLPPPPGSLPVAGISPLPSMVQPRTSATNSPSLIPAQPAPSEQPRPSNVPESKPLAAIAGPISSKKADKGKSTKAPTAVEPAEASKAAAAQANGGSNGINPIEEEKEEEPYFHLPPEFNDLVETLKKSNQPANSPAHLRMLSASHNGMSLMDASDMEPSRTYRPEAPYHMPSGYPQEPLPIFDNPQLYTRIEPDTLFYVFYYKQASYQQFLAAKALKDQSWRFHKQYQTWFQRHEEPKSITEEYEQGTYRFFDYESTWMNRRKADFKFAYRYLEDDV